MFALQNYFLSLIQAYISAPITPGSHSAAPVARTRNQVCRYETHYITYYVTHFVIILCHKSKEQKNTYVSDDDLLYER